MPSLAASIDWLQRTQRRTSVAGVAVTLRRGGATTALTAVIGRTDFVQEQDGTIVARSRHPSFLIAVADYAFEGQLTEPQEADRITLTLNGVEAQFEVAPTGSEPPYVYSDSGRTQYRVHTVQVE